MSLDYQEVLEISFLGNTIADYCSFIIISIVSYLIFKIVIIFALKKLEKLAHRTSTKIDDFVVEVLKNVKWSIFSLVVLFTAQNTLNLDDSIEGITEILIIGIITYEIVKILVKVVDFSAENLLQKKSHKAAQGQIIILSKVIKIVFWIVGITLFLSNIGYDVTSIVAGLGIGSLAVALAIQNILGDMLSSFSIYFDKPFRIGDAIQMGEYKGTVMSIGIKTTRIKTLQGEELVVPNNKLTSTEIQNYGKLKTRRVELNFGVRYDTPIKKLKKINEMVEKIINSVKKVEFVRSHFSEFGESALMFEVIYVVDSDDYIEHMDCKEKIHFEVAEAFEKEKIEFAFPTRTVIMEK